MNTTPIPFNTNTIPYTIVGNSTYNTLKEPIPCITILLLNRGGKFHREELLTSLRSIPFAETLFIEGPELTYDIEPLSKKFPDVRYLLLRQKISAGEKINLGISESRTDLVFVLWSDMKIEQAFFTEDCVKRMNEKKLLCNVPIIKNTRQEIVPNILVPGLIRRDIKVVPWIPGNKKVQSIFPFDYCGIYNKKRFTHIGGYDSHIANPYWQKMDFGFRAFLWGEYIRLNPDLELSYTHDVNAEDATPDRGYKIFYLKNIFVTCKKGRGFLPSYKFFHYLFHSDTGPIDSFKEFRIIQKWVEKNSERFRIDAFTLVKSWEVPE